MAGRFTGTDSQDLAPILDPFRVIFVDLGPDRQMSAVETEPMSAAETGQMSALVLLCKAEIAKLSAHLWRVQVAVSLYTICPGLRR